MEIHHADHDEDNPQIANSEPIHILDSEIIKMFEKPRGKPEIGFWRMMKTRINRFFWVLKHRIVIELQLETNNTVLYKELVGLRKSWGAF